MKNSLALTIAMVVSLTLPSTHYAKEPAKKKSQEEAVPLVTEVMTKEELQAYLKEKGIPIITKANFKEPELMWEKTFDEWIREISDITEKGNCIIVAGPFSGTQPDTSLLFITSKGEVRKKINLGKTKEDSRDAYVTATVAKSGSYAAVFKISGTGEKRERLLSYYDEEGKKLWTKSLDKAHISILSYNGEVTAVEDGNPNWDEEEWSAGNKNINKVRFYNFEGKLLSEYGGYRNFSQWALSDDGKYFAAFAWWMDEQDRETGSLIYFDVNQGKILWQKPLNATHWLQVGGPYSLAVSEKGSYVAAAVLRPDRKPASTAEDKEVIIFNRAGKPIVRVPGKKAGKIREDGFCSSGDIKGWINITKSKNTGLFGYPPYFLKINEIDTVDEKTNDRFAKTHRIVSKEEAILWEKDLVRGQFSFTKNWRYLVGTQYIDKNHKKIIVYKLIMNLPR